MYDLKPLGLFVVDSYIYISNDRHYIYIYQAAHSQHVTGFTIDNNTSNDRFFAKLQLIRVLLVFGCGYNKNIFSVFIYDILFSKQPND